MIIQSQKFIILMTGLLVFCFELAQVLNAKPRAEFPITFDRPIQNPLLLAAEGFIEIGGTCFDSGGEVRNLELVVYQNALPVGSPLAGFQCDGEAWSLQLNQALIPDSVPEISQLRVRYTNDDVNEDEGRYQINNVASRAYLRNSQPGSNTCPILSISTTPLQGVVGQTYDRSFFLQGVSVSDVDDTIGLNDIEISGVSIPFSPLHTGVIEILYSVADEDPDCLQTASRLLEIGNLLNPSLCAEAPDALNEIPADCIPIYNAEGLQSIQHNLSANYCLVNDINMEDAEWIPIGFPSRSSLYSHLNFITQRGAFTGRLLGQGFTIRNLSLERGRSVAEPSQYPHEKTYLGLFGYAQCAVIQDVNFENIQMGGFQFVGALVGASQRSRFQNISMENVSVEARRQLGGLAGEIVSSVVDESSVVGSVRGPVTEIVPGRAGSEDAGGLVGSLRKSRLQHSSFEGIGADESCPTNPLCSHVHAAGAAGGIVGRALDSNIQNSESNAFVIGGTYGGGLVGWLESERGSANILQSKSHGRVGLPSEFMQNYSNPSRVTGKAGGLVGYAYLDYQYDSQGRRYFSSQQSVLVEESFSDASVHAYGFYSAGQVSPNAGDSGSAGGLVGGGTGLGIRNSYYRGSLIEIGFYAGASQRIAGGLAGKLQEAVSDLGNRPSVIENSYAATQIVIRESSIQPEWQWVGGLVGYSFGANNILSSYFDADLAELEPQHGNSYGESRSTSQMQSQSNFVNWDFQNVWELPTANYPRFRGEALLCGADFNQDGVLNVQDIFDFLGAWFAQGSIDVEDLFTFLGLWFAGC